MKRTYKWILPTLMLATLSFSACKQEPVVPAGQSTVDEGLWTLDAWMDTTVRPGDDFDMYCNGTWWQTADPGEFGLNSFFEKDLLSISQEYLKDVMNSSFGLKLMALATTAFDTSERSAARMAKAVDMVNGATTVEELWHVMGKLMKEGYKTPFHLHTFASHGNLCPTFNASNGSDFVGSDLDIKKIIRREQMRSQRGAFRMMTGEPRETPKPIAETNWPMFSAMCSELGLDPALTYTINDIGDQSDWDHMDDPQIFNKLQAMDLDQLRTEVLRWLELDRACYDATVYESVDKASQTLMITVLVPITPLYSNYLNYTNSYYVAKQRGWTSAQGNEIKQFCNELRDAFRERIQANTWVSEAGKSMIINKLDNLQMNIFAPDRWMENGVADIDTCTTFYSAVLNIRANHYDFVRSLQGMPRSEAAFLALIDSYMSLTSVNACYAANFNGIFIMPVMCSSEMYDPAVNMALNYAHFAVCCHEIGHGFDSSGSQYGPDGTMGNFWASDADKQEFERRVQMVVEHYSKMQMQNGQFINGEKTKVENTADIVGLNIAYQAYCKYLTKNGYTGDQLKLQKQRFFRGYAHLFHSKYALETLTEMMGKDPHSPYPARINGPVAQIDDWYELFDVKEGDKLYLKPEDRIRIW